MSVVVDDDGGVADPTRVLLLWVCAAVVVDRGGTIKRISIPGQCHSQLCGLTIGHESRGLFWGRRRTAQQQLVVVIVSTSDDDIEL